MISINVVKGATASILFAQHHGRRKPRGQVIVVKPRPEGVEIDTFIRNTSKGKIKNKK